MPDVPQTAEAVAYALLHDIARAEGVGMGTVPGSSRDRAWLLETFAECLKCVKAEAPKPGPVHSRGSF